MIPWPAVAAGHAGKASCPSTLTPPPHHPGPPPVTTCGKKEVIIASVTPKSIFVWVDVWRKRTQNSVLLIRSAQKCFFLWCTCAEVVSYFSLRYSRPKIQYRKFWYTAKSSVFKFKLLVSVFCMLPRLPQTSSAKRTTSYTLTTKAVVLIARKWERTIPLSDIFSPWLIWLPSRHKAWHQFCWRYRCVFLHSVIIIAVESSICQVFMQSWCDTVCLKTAWFESVPTLPFGSCAVAGLQFYISSVILLLGHTPESWSFFFSAELSSDKWHKKSAGSHNISISEVRLQTRRRSMSSVELLLPKELLSQHKWETVFAFFFYYRHSQGLTCILLSSAVSLSEKLWYRPARQKDWAAAHLIPDPCVQPGVEGSNHSAA